MRLSNPTAIKFVALLVSWLLRLWMGTLSWRFHYARGGDCAGAGGPAGAGSAGADDDRDAGSSGRPARLYLFWHENLLMPAYTHASLDIPVLVSQHRDGELISQVVRMLRGSTVRGSTTRGGAAALRRMARMGRLRALAITPDGPRGPRRSLQVGAVYLASRAGMVIVPSGMAYSRCWRAPSWDRLAIPKLFAAGVCVAGDPITVPPDIDRDEMERYRLLIERRMLELQATAEALAAGRPGPAAMTLEQAQAAIRREIG